MLSGSLSTGFLFDIEGDWLRDDAEVERIDAYIRQFHNDKRVNRGAPVWEKMPLMFFVDGVFDRLCIALLITPAPEMAPAAPHGM
jgi:hypothetical protein